MEMDPNPSPLDQFTRLPWLRSTSSAAAAAAIQLCCCCRHPNLLLLPPPPPLYCRRPLPSLKAHLAGPSTISRRMSKSQTKYLDRLMCRENIILEQSREIIELKQEIIDQQGEPVQASKATGQHGPPQIGRRQAVQ